MTLDQGKPGETYAVVGMELSRAVHNRLEALGMTAGSRILVLENKGKGILVVKLRGTRFALGRGITRRIEVV